MVGEAVTRITRTALTLGGAHGIFKGSRLEQLFRDGALAPLHPPPADFCLYNMGIFELGLDPADVLRLSSRLRRRPARWGIITRMGYVFRF
jgi:hypothetical protein